MNKEEKRNWAKVVLHTIFLFLVALWNLRLIGILIIGGLIAQAMTIWARCRGEK